MFHVVKHVTSLPYVAKINHTPHVPVFPDITIFAHPDYDTGDYGLEEQLNQAGFFNGGSYDEHPSLLMYTPSVNQIPLNVESPVGYSASNTLEQNPDVQYKTMFDHITDVEHEDADADVEEEEEEEEEEERVEREELEVQPVPVVTVIKRGRGRPKKNSTAPNATQKPRRQLLLEYHPARTAPLRTTGPSVPAGNKRVSTVQFCRNCNARAANRCMQDWELTVPHFSTLGKLNYFGQGDFVYVDLPGELGELYFDVAKVEFHAETNNYFLYSLSHMCYYQSPCAWLHALYTRTHKPVAIDLVDKMHSLCESSCYEWIRTESGVLLRDMTIAAWDRMFGDASMPHVCVSMNWDLVSRTLTERHPILCDAKKREFYAKYPKHAAKIGGIMMQVQNKASADTQVIVKNMVTMLYFQTVATLRQPIPF
jgi:hypothetical protein